VQYEIFFPKKKSDLEEFSRPHTAMSESKSAARQQRLGTSRSDSFDR
jgi:hypothetical protein